MANGMIVFAGRIWILVPLWTQLVLVPAPALAAVECGQAWLVGSSASRGWS